MSGASPSFSTRGLSRGSRILLATAFVGTLALGTYGYLWYEREAGTVISVWTALYHAAQLFLLHAPHFEHHVNPALEVARWSGALFLGGTVYQIARQLFAAEFAALRRRRLRGHLVIGGLGRRALACVRGERDRPRGARRRVVVVDRAPAPELAAACQKLGAELLVGEIQDPAVLRAAGLGRAAELWALCPEDSVNCETAVQAGSLLATGARREPLRCNVHLSDIDLRVELQRHAGSVVGDAPLELRFFDLYDFEARRVLLETLPLDHAGIAATDPLQPHLVILGFGRMGRSVAVRAAKLGHFANAVRNPGLKLRISVIDREGSRNEAALLFRYPQFREACALDVHSLDIESPLARRLLEAWCRDPETRTSVAVCFDDEARAVEVALRMLPAVTSRQTRVAVRLARRGGLQGLVERVWGTPDSGAGSRVPVRSFGLLEEGCCAVALDHPINERLARGIHEAFVADRTSDAGRGPQDASLAPWEALPEDLRESNRQQADHVVIKLRAIGCELADRADPRPALERFRGDEVELLAQLEHLRWCAERRLADWSPGPRNVMERTSPYLVDWELLPPEVQDYDRRAVQGIPALLDRIGRKAVRG